MCKSIKIPSRQIPRSINFMLVNLVVCMAVYVSLVPGTMVSLV